MRMPATKLAGYALCVTGVMLLFDTYIFLRTDWSPLHIPMLADAELELGYGLVFCGAFVVWGPALLRRFGRIEESTRIPGGFEYHSVEARLRRRLPLAKMFSMLPDRAVVGGSVVLLILVPTFLIVIQQFHPYGPAEGIHVRLFPRYTWSLTPSCPQVILVQLKSEGDSTQVLLNGRKINSQQIGVLLTNELGKRPDWQVFLDADGDVSVGDAIQVMDAIRSVHADAVILTSQLKHQIFRENCNPE